MLPPKVAVVGALVTGTIMVLGMKSMYELSSTGLNDANHSATHTFEKPGAVVLLMFLGMLGCVPFASDWPDCKTMVQLAICAVFDLIATGLLMIGLLWVSASTMRVVKSSCMIFTALYSIVFLKRTFTKKHFLALGCVLLGTTIAIVSSMESGASSNTGSAVQQGFGIALIVLGQAVQAAQFTFEDFFMSEMQLSAFSVVGIEGLWGTLFTVCGLVVAQFAPGNDVGGVMENSVDSIKLINSSRILLYAILSLMLSFFSYNYTALSVTGSFSAVFRTVLDSMRTLFIWLVELALFYEHVGDLGASWTIYSPLKAVGFMIVVAATLLYANADKRLKAKQIESQDVAETTQSTSTSISEPVDQV
jgi:hypothetical protein